MHALFASETDSTVILTHASSGYTLYPEERNNGENIVGVVVRQVTDDRETVA